jgi:predicted ATP-dependent endonuclease of OLD family
MELVYLWVEEYKNIKEEGFNFSPRFECDYDGKNLTIEPKEYTSIFPDNINITAIVGENGSGKSSILECLTNILNIEDLDNKYILVFDEFYISNIENINTSLTKKSFSDSGIKAFLYNYNLNYINDILDRRNVQNIDIRKQAIVNALTVNIAKNTTFELSSFMYIPNSIEIKPKGVDKLLDYFIQFTLEDYQKVKEEFDKLTNKYSKYKFLYKLKNKKDSLSKKDFKKYFCNSVSKDIKDLTSDEKDIYIGANGYYEFFDIDLIDDKERRYNDLSHGEQTLFGQLLNIYFYIFDCKNNNFLFLFDEPEISLHPNWQKAYINEVYNLIKQFSSNKISFILTSHSPFILSDLPKENVIFLKNGKQDKTVDIDTFGANIHTLLSHGFFMSDGLMGEFAKSKINKILFFLNGKNKFIDFPLNQIKPIIEKIGEEFLKEKLLDMYNKKFIKEHKEREKEYIRQQINNLENKYKELDK